MYRRYGSIYVGGGYIVAVALAIAGCASVPTEDKCGRVTLIGLALDHQASFNKVFDAIQ